MSLEGLKALAFLKTIHGRLAGLCSTKHVWKYRASKMKFLTVAEGLEKIKEEYLNGEVPEGIFADYLVLHFDECFDASIDPILAILAIQEFRQWNYKMEGKDAIETFGGTEELSENEFYGFVFMENGQEMQLPDGVRVGIKQADGGIVLDEGIIACFSKEKASPTHLTAEQMSVLKTQRATVVTEYSKSVTTSEEDDIIIIKIKYTFDNGLIIIEKEELHRNGWNVCHMSYIVDGHIFELRYWDRNGFESECEDLKMPHIINLLSVMHQYDRDPEKNNRLIKLASLSLSSQTFLDREMPYFVA